MPVLIRSLVISAWCLLAAPGLLQASPLTQALDACIQQFESHYGSAQPTQAHPWQQRCVELSRYRDSLQRAPLQPAVGERLSLQQLKDLRLLFDTPALASRQATLRLDLLPDIARQVRETDPQQAEYKGVFERLYEEFKDWLKQQIRQNEAEGKPNLLRNIFQSLQNFLQSLEDNKDTLTNGLILLTMLVTLIFIYGVVSAQGLRGLWQSLRRQGQRPPLPPHSPTPASGASTGQQRLYALHQQALSTLEHHHLLQRHPATTLGEYRQSMARHGEPLAGHYRQLALQTEAGLYGPRPPAEAQLQQAEAAARAISETLEPDHE